MSDQQGMVNEEGDPVDLYIPRKWYVTQYFTIIFKYCLASFGNAIDTTMY